MMTPDIEKIEHLLNAKSFGELSVAERELVLAHLSGANEYEHMRETLQRVKKVFTAEAVAMQTDAQLKEQILHRFEQNKPKPSSPFAGIATFFQTLIPSPTMRFASVFGVLVLIIAGTLFIFPSRKNDLAQNIETQKSIPAPPPTDAFEKKESEMTVPMESAAEEKAVSTMTESSAMGDEVRPMMVEKRAVNEDMADQYMPQPVAASGAVAEESSAPMQNQIYRNDDGYLQYQNSRVAESTVKTKDKSDAYKDYSSKAKKAEVAEEKAAPGNVGPVVLQETSNKEEEEMTLRGSRGSAQGKYAQPSAIPAWPGVEKDGRNAHAATTEKIKNYLREELVGSYKTDPRLESPLSIQITFTAKGKVSAVEVKGQASEAQQKAIVNKINKLPTFKFTEGANPVLVQNYVIIP